jgi:hypothetical protein
MMRIMKTLNVVFVASEENPRTGIRKDGNESASRIETMTTTNVDK